MAIIDLMKIVFIYYTNQFKSTADFTAIKSDLMQTVELIFDSSVIELIQC